MLWVGNMAPLRQLRFGSILPICDRPPVCRGGRSPRWRCWYGHPRFFPPTGKGPSSNDGRFRHDNWGGSWPVSTARIHRVHPGALVAPVPPGWRRPPRGKPGRLWKGLVLSCSTKERMAALSSARVKNWRWRSRARIQRSAICTLTYAKALSRGFLTRAGMTATP